MKVNTNNEVKENRILYYDVLNVIACLAVIILHHNGMVWKFSASFKWKISLAIECAFFWAVPVFLMLTGATLLDYRRKYSTKTFFEKRITRTVIPWLCWSLVLLIWKSQTGQIQLESNSLHYLIQLVMSNKIENIYWFFMALFGIYLSVPVLSLLISKRSILWYIVGLNFLFASCIPVYNTITGNVFSISIPFVNGLIIFPVLGYLLSTENIGVKYRVSVYVLAILATIFRYVYTWEMSNQIGSFDTSIKGYEKFYSVFLATAIFLLVKNIPWYKIMGTAAKRYIHIFAANSFGVYLIHKIIMYYEINLLNVNTTSYKWRTLGVVLTYSISLFVSIILGSIPGIKKIMGK